MYDYKSSYIIVDLKSKETVRLKEKFLVKGFSGLAEQLLKQLKSMGYSASTLAAYKCALKKSKYLWKKGI